MMTRRTERTRTATRAKGAGSTRTRRSGAEAKGPSSVAQKDTVAPAGAKRRLADSPRFAAPGVRLGMTAHEVKSSAGAPDCILFRSDRHVEWQYGSAGRDVSGAPALYVTTITFEMGRAACITERLAKQNEA